MSLVVSIRKALAQPIVVDIQSGSSGGSFVPATLFFSGENGGMWDATDGTMRFQTSALTTPAVSDDPLGGVKDQSPNLAHAVQATAGSRPYVRTIKGALAACNIGTFTLAAAFSGALGSNCTIALAFPGGGCDIIEGQTIGSSYTFTVPFSYALIINRPLTQIERDGLRQFLNAKSGATSIIWHDQVIGQSLAEGGQANAVVDGVNHTPNAFMFTLTGTGHAYGPRTGLDGLTTNAEFLDYTKVTGIEPLKEAVGVSGQQNDSMGETICTGMYAQFLKGRTEKALVDCLGVGSHGYADLGSPPGLGPNTLPLANGQTSQLFAGRFIRAAGSQHVAGDLILVHGEADALNSTTQAAYEGYLAEWPTLYGQRDGVHKLRQLMFISQLSAMSYGPNSFDIAKAMLKSALDHPTNILVGPKYDVPYIDTAHLVAASYRQTGDMIGKVRRRVKFEGVTWLPMYAVSAAAVGNTIEVTCNLPVGNTIQIDTTIVAAITNYGVTISNAGGRAITGVTVSGKKVVVALDGAPASGTIVEFAKTQPGATPGPTNGARTNFTDQDTEVGVLSGAVLVNRMCHCQVTLP